MSQSLTQDQLQRIGARCDICPLRKGGGLFGEEEWKPVGSERHPRATVIAVAESPGP